MNRRVWVLLLIAVLPLVGLSVATAASAGSPAILQLCDQNVAPHHFACFAERLSLPAIKARPGFAPAAEPSGYGPSDLSSAYRLGSAPSGAGRRVFVIGAFDDAHAASDLAIYRNQYGLPACTVGNGCFKKLNQNGATSPLPAVNTGWAGETSLDLDMVSATCPACSITLIEASGSGDELMVATREAAKLGAQYVSMSWGGEDNSSDKTYDAAYLQSTGVLYSVATGDNGYAGGPTYPATSPYVIAVGGTSLSTSGSARGWDETAWNGGNSGCTTHESTPSWQASAGTSCSGRAIADVSAVADPNTGVAVYDTYESGWGVYGGTSAATPIIASIAARAGAIGNPDAASYGHPAAFNDVVSGNNSALCLGNVACQAGVGWDGVTGLGSPSGVAAFAGTSAASVCTGNMISNSGFELGSAGWSVAASRIRRSASLAHTGSQFALLDSTGHAHTDRLTRTIRIPTSCRATLSYYLRVSSADTSRTAHDRLTLRVNRTTLQSRSNTNRSAHYQRIALNLGRYAGKTITLSWVGTENSSKATGFYFDDIRVTLSH